MIETQLKDFYTAKELAELLNILPSAITRHIRNGTIKAEKIGNSYIIKKEAVEEYLQTRERGGKK